MTAKPNPHVDIITLLAPDEQLITRIFPLSSFPPTIPTWDVSLQANTLTIPYCIKKFKRVMCGTLQVTHKKQKNAKTP